MWFYLQRKLEKEHSLFCKILSISLFAHLGLALSLFVVETYQRKVQRISLVGNQGARVTFGTGKRAPGYGVGVSSSVLPLPQVHSAAPIADIPVQSQESIKAPKTEAPKPLLQQAKVSTEKPLKKQTAQPKVQQKIVPKKPPTQVSKVPLKKVSPSKKGIFPFKTCTKSG